MFQYDKQSLFAEFKVAKEKDIALSKKTTYEEKEQDVFVNRRQFFKDHIKLKSENPKVYANVDVNFEKLQKLWESSNPRDAFYMAIFGMTYAQKKADEERQSIIEEIADKKNKNVKYVEDTLETSEVAI